jgi:hypothetical protein
MALPVFVKVIPTWGGASPAVSGSYTPGGAGNSLFFLAASGGGNSIAFLMTGSASSGFNDLATLSPTGGGTRTLIDCPSCAAGAQTFTINDQIANFDNVFEGIEYSGVGTITNAALTNVANPGTGVGAILGASIVVPTGSLLLACCYEGTSAETITNTSGTSRGSSASNPIYNWVEYTGAGSAIQPAFTTSANGTLTYLVAQFILSPPVGVHYLTKWLPFRWAAAMRSLQQGINNVGNRQQNRLALAAAAITQANGAATWAKWRVGKTSTLDTNALLLDVPLVPGFVPPVGTVDDGT